jgi:hypothetical protein
MARGWASGSVTLGLQMGGRNANWCGGFGVPGGQALGCVEENVRGLVCCPRRCILTSNLDRESVGADKLVSLRWTAGFEFYVFSNHEDTNVHY